ncbi:MAG: hypothetical protein RSA75_09900, partial [Bacteroidales bacterium]
RWCPVDWRVLSHHAGGYCRAKSAKLRVLARWRLTPYRAYSERCGDMAVLMQVMLNGSGYGSASLTPTFGVLASSKHMVIQAGPEH